MAQVGIFVGTVYGNALLVAEEAETILIEQGHEVKLFEEGTLEEWQAYHQHYALVVTSTTGQEICRTASRRWFRGDSRSGRLSAGAALRSDCAGRQQL